MSTRPLIGYPARSGITAPASTMRRFGNNESYANAIVDNGGAPLMIPSIPNTEVLDRIYGTLDGLLLTGGPDILPARYGAEKHARTDDGDVPMEEVEFYLTRRALADGLPLLGICRGIQTLNVVAGGTLYQHIADEYETGIEHAAYALGRGADAHTIRITQGSRLRRVAGRDELPVNSLHHQAVRDLAPGYVATATAPDGLIEAIERPDLLYVVAVQWHPEELYRDHDAWKRLFADFITAAEQRAASRTERVPA